MKPILSIFFLLIFNFSFSNTIDDNSVTITTIGNGATFEKARESALFSAITQVCGVYLSQDVKISNDEVVKEEITSITKGNIEKYSILSEVKIDNDDCVSTLKVIVSVFNLKTYMESKGYKVDFNGAAFAMNMNLKILNEQAENKAITSMFFYLDKIAKNSFDFEINASDPISVNGSNSLWKIPLTINVKPNLNFKTIPEYLVNTLIGISLTEDEKNNYITLNKNVYVVNIQKIKNACNSNYHTFYLRNKKSAVDIAYFVLSFQDYLTNFEITDGNNIIMANEKEIIKDNFMVCAELYDRAYVKETRRPYYFQGNPDRGLYDWTHGYFPGLVHEGTPNNIYTRQFGTNPYIALSGYVFQFNDISRNGNSIVIKINDIKSLDEIKRIKGYSVEKK